MMTYLPEQRMVIDRDENNIGPLKSQEQCIPLAGEKFNIVGLSIDSRLHATGPIVSTHSDITTLVQSGIKHIFLKLSEKI